MQRPKEENYNVVYDYNKLQGYTHPSDSSIQIPRNIDARYISVENSSTDEVGVAITTGGCCDWFIPKLQFRMLGGENKFLGVNTHGGPLQYIHLLDPQTGKPVSKSCPVSSDANQYVLRKGINGWFTQRYKSNGYKG